MSAEQLDSLQIAMALKRDKPWSLCNALFYCKMDIPRKVASYQVEVPSRGQSVWRKQSDFAWLRALLAARYLGMLVPSLPAKLKGNATMALAEPRKRLLRIFLGRIAADESLSKDAAVLEFLSNSNDVVRFSPLSLVVDVAAVFVVALDHRALHLASPGQSTWRRLFPAGTRSGRRIACGRQKLEEPTRRFWSTRLAFR